MTNTERMRERVKPHIPTPITNRALRWSVRYDTYQLFTARGIWVNVKPCMVDSWINAGLKQLHHVG